VGNFSIDPLLIFIRSLIGLMSLPNDDIEISDAELEILRSCFKSAAKAESCPHEPPTHIASPTRSTSQESVIGERPLDSDSQKQQTESSVLPDGETETGKATASLHEASPPTKDGSEFVLIETRTEAFQEHFPRELMPTYGRSPMSSSGSRSFDSESSFTNISLNNPDLPHNETNQEQLVAKSSPGLHHVVSCDLEKNKTLVVKSLQEEPHVDAPVRGRMFTKPAWLTAQLVPQDDTDVDSRAVKREQELDELEQQILSVKREVAELDKLLSQKKQERDELRKHYACLIQTGYSNTTPPQGVSPMMPQTVLSPERLIVELEKQPNQPLGLSVGYESTYFYVNEVKQEGCIPEWNRARQMVRDTSIVERGDMIVEVNGIRADKESMTKEFKSSRIRLVINKPRPKMENSADSPQRPPPTLHHAPRRIDVRNWPMESLEAYYEISDALTNRGHRDSVAKTGIMKFGDTPVRLPDEDGVYTCQLCAARCSTESDWIRHFASSDHLRARDQRRGEDCWTQFSLENGNYWYEHTMGFWSIDEPDARRTGNHTVIRN
jgi:hypothetical protein